MWMKVDDGLHAHRKTRNVAKTHETKRRDIAPMGLWVVAGSWASQNGTDGWVPAEELDRWDDDWEVLVDRLVKAGYWWPLEHEGEAGYAFVDWQDYNPSQRSSEMGSYGNHVRWHEKRKVVDPECDHCPKEPDDTPDIHPDSGGDRGAISGDDRGGESPNIALPDPTRPDPDPIPTRSPVAKRRGQQLPADFVPNEKHIQMAAELGIDLRFEFGKFRDYWIGEGKPKADWDATLRNWIRTAAERKGNVRPLTRVAPNGQPVIGLAPDDKR